MDKIVLNGLIGDFNLIINALLSDLKIELIKPINFSYIDRRLNELQTDLKISDCIMDLKPDIILNELNTDSILKELDNNLSLIDD